MITGPGHVFINHTKDFEFFTGVNDKLVQYAAAPAIAVKSWQSCPTVMAAQSTRYTVPSLLFRQPFTYNERCS